MSVFLLPPRPEKPGLGELLGAGLGQGISSGIQMLAQQKLQDMAARGAMLQDVQQKERQKQTLIQSGFTPEEAETFVQLHPGAQTEYFRRIQEQQERGLRDRERAERAGLIERREEVPGEIPKERGLTEAERVRREESRYKSNLPLYTANKKKVEGLQNEKIRIEALQNLNETQKLPKFFGKLLNVQWESGNLRFPAAASPEAQTFVKIINDFISGAKDSFGARVTNFELNAFLRRLPSLMNSEEGRRAVLRQMEILNDINQLYHEGVDEIINKAGGIRNVDWDRVTGYVRRQNAKKLENLRKEYSTINQITEGPIVRQYKKQLESGEVLMLSPNGKYKAVSKKDINAAEKEGYILMR